jgi:hypothetical protein
MWLHCLINAPGDCSDGRLFFDALRASDDEEIKTPAGETTGTSYKTLRNATKTCSESLKQSPTSLLNYRILD